MPLGIEGVSFGYIDNSGTHRGIFDNLTLELPDTGAFWLPGPSGCGKTTLLRLIAGLEQPRSGRITKPAHWRTGMVFQEDRLLPWHTLSGNVRVVLPQPDRSTAAQTAAEQAVAALDLAGLPPDAAGLYPAACSGGMKRRAAIARALVNDPELLLLDEPFTGLDQDAVKKIAAHLRQRSQRRLIVLVTHKIEEAEAMGAEKMEIF
ncbi:MAG: ATP-binding cassette domain-containing protein [Oscillospiraceae bacterium]|nr:ATP-binding cassette domain-containing protein [Oscillospiraceae bacterium]